MPVITPALPAPASMAPLGLERFVWLNVLNACALRCLARIQLLVRNRDKS
jgi:hypothetical protein